MTKLFKRAIDFLKEHENCKISEIDIYTKLENGHKLRILVNKEEVYESRSSGWLVDPDESIEVKDITEIIQEAI